MQTSLKENVIPSKPVLKLGSLLLCALLAGLLLTACGGGSDGSTPPVGDPIVPSLPDADPDPISFAPRAEVAAGAPVESSPFALGGFDVPVQISVEGGEFSIDGSDYRSTPTTVTSGASVKLRLMASTVAGDTRTAKLTVGGVTGSFSVVTAGGGSAQQVRLLAGSFGSVGAHEDGPADLARFNVPTAVVVDDQGNRYVSDRHNHVIRRIAPNGEVTTVAGRVGLPGSLDGPASQARLHWPTGLALDGLGSLYVADMKQHTIRRIHLSSGEISTVAGKAGLPGTDAGNGTPSQPALLRSPMALAFLNGQLLVLDSGNHAVRRLVAPQFLVPLAGTVGWPGDAQPFVDLAVAHFRFPTGMAVSPADGYIYVADQGNCVVRRITLFAVQIVAGANGDCRSVDGLPDVARLDLTGTTGESWDPTSVGGIALDPKTGRIFVGEKAGIREVNLNGGIRTPSIGTAPGTPGVATSSWQPKRPSGFAFDAAGRLLVAEQFSHAITSIEMTDEANGVGVATTVAGPPAQSRVPGIQGAIGDDIWTLAPGRDGSLLIGGDQVAKRITSAGVVESFLTFDPASNDYAVSATAEAANGMLFALVDQDSFDLDGPMQKVKGYLNGQLSFSIASENFNDNAPAPQFEIAVALGVDSQGRALIADTEASVIRRVDQNGIVTLVAGRAGEFGEQLGDALNEALFMGPMDVDVAANDDIFVLDGYYGARPSRVLKISPVNGRDVVSLVAGDLGDAESMAIDQAGNLYVTQPSDCVILRIRPSGERAVFAGHPGVCTFKPGALPGYLAMTKSFSTSDSKLAVRNNKLVMTMEGKGVVEIGPLPQQ
jgi:DNA-binding beta-propeller fold protein YncE